MNCPVLSFTSWRNTLQQFFHFCCGKVFQWFLRYQEGQCLWGVQEFPSSPSKIYRSLNFRGQKIEPSLRHVSLFSLNWLFPLLTKVLSLGWVSETEKTLLLDKTSQKLSLHLYLKHFVLTRVLIWSTFLWLPPFCRLVTVQVRSQWVPKPQENSKRLYWLCRICL